MVPNRRIRSPPQAKRKSTIHKHSAKTAAATAFYVVAFTTLPACQSLTTSPHFRTPTTRTRSFGAVWADNFASLKERKTKVHTLILGSHPSVTSLEQNRYYAHKQNAFWWIAGDCLGFRRESGYNAQGKPFAITEYLRYHNILSYEKQVETLCSKGFALWDIISSCERKGSLDKDIKKEIPNDIQGFCEQHPHLKRIVLANGGSGSTLFARHFADWWATGDLTHGGNAESVTAFQKLERKVKQHSNNPVVCICALSVSPAAARYDYVTKRDFWEQNVYQPGIELHEQLERETKVGAPGEKSAVNKDITLS